MTGSKTSKLPSVLATFSVLALACATTRVDITRGPRSYEPSDYTDLLDRWSRELKILPVDGIENILSARATFLSHEFRWAYVVRVAHDLRFSPAEREALSDSQQEALSKGHEFFVSLMSGIDKCDNLDPEDGPWLVRLEDDRGRQVAPIEVTEVRRPTAVEIKYFSFDPVHRKAYRLLFPLTAEDGQPIISGTTRFFSLTFSSAFGQGDMRWETTVMDEGE